MYNLLYSIFAFIGPFSLCTMHIVLICVRISMFLLVSKEGNGFDELSEENPWSLSKWAPSLEGSRMYFTTGFTRSSQFSAVLFFSSMVSPAAMEAASVRKTTLKNQEGRECQGHVSPGEP